MKKKVVRFFSISILTLVVCLFSIFWVDRPMVLLFDGVFPLDEANNFTHSLVWLMDSIYFAGYLIHYLPVLALISLLFLRWKLALRLSYIFCTYTVTTIFTIMLKQLFGRNRPSLFLENGLYDFYFSNPLSGCCYESFPSGHTSLVFWSAFSMGFLIPKLRIPLFLYASLIGIGRIVTTLHYFSDVIFGVYISFFIVYLSYEFLEFLIQKIDSFLARWKNSKKTAS